MKLKHLIFLLLICAQPMRSFCWGGEGHKLIGNIAWHYLDQGTKDSLQFYLGSLTLADAGLWMDQMRKNPEYDYMKPWHYIDFNKGENYKPDTTQNVINELRKRIDHLKHRNQYSKEQIAVDIKILVHLCEDLHMPLHVGHPSDTGGNAVHITFMGQPTTLHWAWDNDIMLQQHINLDTCLALLATFTPREIAEKKKINLVLWMNESRSYLPQVYDYKGNSIDEAYADKNAPVIKMRLALAGLRLSGLLNQLFQAKTN